MAAEKLEIAEVQYPIHGGSSLAELLARVEHYAVEARSGGFHGQAVVLTPQDSGFAGVLAEGPRNREAIVHATLDLAQLRRSRIAAGLYAARDQAGRPIPKLAIATRECR